VKIKNVTHRITNYYFAIAALCLQIPVDTACGGGTAGGTG
jgi:hypothetical protein